MRKEAKDLVKNCADLQQQVLEKFATAVLEEVADQIKARDARIAALETTLGTFIAWSAQHLGEHGVKALMEILQDGKLPDSRLPQRERQGEK